MRDDKIDPNAIEELKIARPGCGYFSLEGFPYLPNLKKLTLNCELDTFNGLPDLPELTIIERPVVNFFEGFPNLPNLEVMNLDVGHLESFAGFLALPKLRKLALGGLVIKGINDNYGNESRISATITKNDLIELSKKLPNCEIIMYDFYYDYIFKDGQLTKKKRR